jgi:serine-type D-Ala-D-Ala carboxypeptidase (penicillin-binding protein 5/6)
MTRWRGLGLALAVVAATAATATAPAAERRRAASRPVHPAHAPLRAARAQETPTVQVQPIPPVAYCVVAADTDTELAAWDADRQWPPASLAKMMTVLLALEQVHAGKRTLAESVGVSARAAQQGGSQVFLKAGETFALGDLLAAAMIPSANDAAVAVAEHLAGSTDAFVRRMNARAQALGMTRTVYRTVNGFPPAPGHEPDLTTARDLVRVARELMQYPEALGWSGTREAPFRRGTFTMKNTNRLLSRFAGATGLKTGHTAAAGFSLTASATRGDLTLLAVVLGLPTRSASFDAATRLLGDAFDRYRLLVAARVGMPVGTVPVTGGVEGSVKALPARELRVVVPRSDERQLVVEPRIPRAVAAPVTAQQPLGDLVVRRGADELGRVPVVADARVDAAGWLAWLWPAGRSAEAAR